jgi:hypothetical protein
MKNLDAGSFLTIPSPESQSSVMSKISSLSTWLTIGLTWSKILFASSIIFIVVVMLIGSAWLGYYITLGSQPLVTLIDTKGTDLVMPESFEQAKELLLQTVSAQKEARKTNEHQSTLLKGQISELSILVANKIKQFSAENEASEKKIIARNEASEKKIIGILSSIISESKKTEDSRFNRIEQMVNKVVDGRVSAIQLKIAAGDDRAKQIISRFDSLETRLKEMSAVLKLIEKYREPQELSKTPLTFEEKITKLFDFAEVYVMKYENKDSYALKEWEKNLNNKVENREGDKNRAINEILMEVLPKLKDESKQTEKEIYKASKAFITYRQPDMQLPILFTETVKNDENDEIYGKIVSVICESIKKMN